MNDAPLTGLVIDTVGGVLAGTTNPVVSVTLSNVAVASTPVTWLDTPRPTSMDEPSWNVSLATCAQVTPSGDSKAAIVLPVRVSFTHRGAVVNVPEVLTLAAPSDSRRWNATPFPGDTSMNACAAEGDATS